MTPESAASIPRTPNRSEYRGPITVSDFEIAGRSMRVVRPAEPDRLLDDPHVRDLNRADDYMPYWAYIWPGARMFAEAVAELWGGVEPGNDEVLELGCGLGVGGLAAMALGFRVRFSDYDPAPFEFIHRSVAENGFPADRAEMLLLDWREPPALTFPRIIGADVLYERKLVPLVVDVLDRMLGPGGEALLTSPYRTAAEEFPGQVAARGFACTRVPVRTVDEAGPRQGTVFRVVRREA